MGKINWGRVLLGGIVAGIVANVVGYVVDGVWLAPHWTEGQSLLNHPPFGHHMMLWAIVNAFICGILIVWLYAAMRPRFGAGIGTAVCAGVFFWVVDKLLPHFMFMVAMHTYSKHLALYTTAGAFVQIVVAAIAGAWLYKES